MPITQILILCYNENINKYLQKWKEVLAEKNKTKIMVLWASKNEDHGIYALSDQKDKIIKCYQDLYWNDNVEDLEEWKKIKNISEDTIKEPVHENYKTIIKDIIPPKSGKKIPKIKIFVLTCTSVSVPE